MGIIGGRIGYDLLRLIAPRNKTCMEETGNEESYTKLEQFFGSDFFDLIHGKTVIDFGCGNGDQAVEMARRGAGKVIGIDIQPERLLRGRQKAQQFRVVDRCVFTTEVNESADVIISKDAFEHFSNPASILDIMARLLKPKGFVLAAFGPTWLHPYGGHLFSVFPWSHLIFTETAQIRWRSDFKTDGATKFSEVAGGLNQMTIAHFRHLVEASHLSFEWLETVPIRGLHILKLPLLQEFGSSIVRCKLISRNATQ